MQRSLDHVLVQPESSLTEVMSRLERTGLGIVLVVDEGGHLLGTVTDGDVRRAVLGGLAPEASASDVMQRSPVTADEGDTSARHLELMVVHGIDQIPIVDCHTRVVGLRHLRDFAADFDHSDTQVIILAGGFGRRLQPLTSTVPKPLLKVGDRPLIDTLLLQFARQGFRDVTITVHYLAEMIENHVGDGAKFGVCVNYIRETSPLGTAGSIRLAAKTADRPVIVMNSDILTRVPFNELRGHHVSNGNDLTLTMATMDIPIPYGVVDVDGLLVTGIREKPTLRQFVSAGISVLNPSIVALIPPNQRIDMPEVVSLAIANGYTVGGFPIVEFWRDIGQMDDYELANREYSRTFEGTIAGQDAGPIAHFAGAVSA